MASATSSTPFRFRDVPGEIRNKIYRIALCSFSPPPTTITIQPSSFLTATLAEHQVETAILRVSKETYREAYSVMIKTNRFVKVTSSRGLPMRLAMAGQAVRMIAIDRDIVDRFKGYVLGVHIGFKLPQFARSPLDSENLREPVTAMILYSDLDRFCKALNDGDLHDPGFSEKIKISITMAPVLDVASSNTLSPDLNGFFTKKTQETLFMPFMANLFGYGAVDINGHVDSALAATVRQSLGQDRCYNPAAVLAEFAAAKDRGSQQFKDGQFEEAVIGWQDAVYDMDQSRESNSWPNVVRKGGDAFVAEMAALYFLMQLNIAHIQIANMQKNAFGAELLADGALNSATRSLKPGFWKPDYKYRPSPQQFAKLRYRYAMFMRLEENPQNANRALSFIDKALVSQPGDGVLLRERENILGWIQRL
ncbi:uncharacterized protein J4E92_010282 [Alternaria infectoria]|uniref:uncharacterized protein n=1 Tax=Alternaria infectoria TaxID=45303 RepID=UPI00222049D7|nr:uncharacterized protein J4E92_010282 [Alternaria infectoria]KAI4911227.1 hypothetical protein J4E92_010282 [Alternaria infectoria]